MNAPEKKAGEAAFRALLRQAMTEVRGREPTDAELDERETREFGELSREFGPDFWARLAERAPERVAAPTWMTAEQLKEAESAIWYARAHGITSITKALEWHREHGQAAQLAPVIRVCADEYHIVKRCEGRAPGTRWVYRKRLAPFVEEFGERRPMTITPEEIVAHLEKWPRPATKAIHWETLSTFFQWLVKMRYALVNPLPLALKRPTSAAGARLIYTPEEAEFILRETMETDQIGYWALALLAGLRNEEIAWIQGQSNPWEIIRLRERRIDLRRLPTKGARRVVPIVRALRTWMNRVRRDRVPLYPPNFWEKFRVIRAMALGPRYASAAAEAEGKGGQRFEGKAVYAMARRSYVSYRVALAGASFAELSDEVGNTETFIRSHFFRKATAEDARKYFGLAPREVARRARAKEIREAGGTPVTAAGEPAPPGGARSREILELQKRVAELERTVTTIRDAQFALLPGHYGFANVDAFLTAVRAAAVPRRGHITESVRAEVRRLTRAGMTGKEIAKAVAISRASVYNVQKELGLLKGRKGRG